MKTTALLRLMGAFLLIILFGCEQDPSDSSLEEADEISEDVQEAPTLNYVTDLDIPDVMGELTARVPEEKAKRTTAKMRYNNVDIYLKEIKEVIAQGNESSYSFALEVKDQPYHIYNLIIAKDAHGRFKEPYIIGYEMEPDEMMAFFDGGEDFGKFKATYKYYSFDSFFEDSKFGKVGKNGDCGGGSTGGSGAPAPSSTTPAGGSFTHTYQGNTVTSNFRDRNVQIPYGYSITINPGDGSSSTAVTNAITPVETITAGISDAGNTPTASLPNYGTETITWTETRVDWSPGPDGGSTGSTGYNCSRMVISIGSIRIESSIQCVQITNSNKRYTPGSNKTDTCLDTSGATAINTAAKPVQKLHGYIRLNSEEIAYFDKNDTTRALAQQINRFLIAQRFTLKSIELAKEVVGHVLKEDVEYPSCESFEFSTVVGNNGWTAAGVSGVWDVAWKFGRCPGLAAASFSEPIYFQLPGYYNNEMAASTSALLLWTAFENWGVWYRRTYAADCVSD